MNIINDSTIFEYSNREYNATELRFLWDELEQLVLHTLKKNCRALLIDDNSLIGALLYAVLFFNNYNVLAVSSSVLEKNHEKICDNFQYEVLINCVEDLLLDLNKYNIHSINQFCILNTDLIIAKTFFQSMEQETLGEINFFSSGSSGTPKLITHSHESTLNYILDSINVMQIDSTTRHIVCSSIGWDVWLTEVFSIMIAGGYILLCDRLQISNPFFFRENY